MDRQKIERFEKLGTFILGGVAGTVAGILISPRSGRELRGAMSSRAGEARERGRENYFEARERARERLAGMREPRFHADEDAGTFAGTPGGSLSEGPGETEDGQTVRPVPQVSEVSEEPPLLRAVPPEDQEEALDVTSEDSEALRIRIRQTRERLRSRRSGGGADG